MVTCLRNASKILNRHGKCCALLPMRLIAPVNARPLKFKGQQVSGYNPGFVGHCRGDISLCRGFYAPVRISAVKSAFDYEITPFDGIFPEISYRGTARTGFSAISLDAMH